MSEPLPIQRPIPKAPGYFASALRVFDLGAPPPARAFAFLRVVDAE